MRQEWQPASKERHLDPSGYFSDRTIAALATPPGGALCVVRVSGPAAHVIAEALTTRRPAREDHRRAFRARLRDSAGRTLDDAVVLPFFGPGSFTGEDVLEVFLHGSPRIAQRVLEECFRFGARPALPGEFSFRAVRNGRLRLSQAEAIPELISAENDFSLELALEKLSGSQHELVARLQSELMQLCTLAEAGIDFSDQDIDEVSLPRLRERLGGIIEALTRLQGSFDRGARFMDGVPVSIFGLPNAGKSSFFNALLGEDRSIVSEVAGTTRDVIREKINLESAGGQVTLRISDTAGLRNSGDRIEEIGIERTIQSARDADLVVVVVDGVAPALDTLGEYLRQVDFGSKRRVWVCTKKDRVGTPDREHLERAIGTRYGGHPVWVTSPSLEGVREAAARMADEAGQLLNRRPGEVILTRMEHVHAVQESLRSLTRAMAATDVVLFATDVRHGMNDLGPLIGETLPDDVLGRIFSDFCIGK